jgi:hypothetical protein
MVLNGTIIWKNVVSMGQSSRKKMVLMGQSSSII